MPNQIKERMSNFELLRIIAMFMIVLHHSIIYGVMTKSLWLNGSRLNQFFVWLYFPGGEIGVGLFFMITGYFLITSDKIKLSKVILQTYFYGVLSVIIYFVACLFGKGEVLVSSYGFLDSEIKIRIISNVFAPLRSSQFWFVSAYIVLLCFKPVYNKFLRKLNKKGYVIFLIILWSFGLVFSTYTVIALGYTKAVFYYALGGYIKRYVPEIKCKKNVVLFLLLSIFLWFMYAVIRFFSMNFDCKNLLIKKCVLLSCSLIPSCCFVVAISISISIFIFFMNYEIQNNGIINSIGSTTFGIYLFHESFFCRFLIWDGIIKVYSKLFQTSLFWLYDFISVCCVFLVTSLFEFLRLKFLEPVVGNIYINICNRINKSLIIEGANNE